MIRGTSSHARVSAWAMVRRTPRSGTTSPGAGAARDGRRRRRTADGASRRGRRRIAGAPRARRPRARSARAGRCPRPPRAPRRARAPAAGSSARRAERLYGARRVRAHRRGVLARPVGGRGGGSRRAVGLDHREHRAHVERVARRPAQPRDDAVRRARDDDGGLVGLDLDEVLVLGHLIALGHLPGHDLGGRDALPDVGQAELQRRHQASSAARIASSTRSTEGT